MQYLADGAVVELVGSGVLCQVLAGVLFPISSRPLAGRSFTYRGGGRLVYSVNCGIAAHISIQ